MRGLAGGEPLPDGALAPGVVALAERHGLAGAAHRVAQDAGDEAIAKRWGEIYRAQVMTALQAQRQLRELGDAFAEREIPLVVLKGAAALTGLYRDPGHRNLSDLDLLIPYDRMGEAREIMAAAGYEPEPTRSSDWEEEALARVSHMRPFRKAHRLPVELHVSILRGALPRDADRKAMEGVLDRSVPVEGIRGLRRPADADFTLHTALHYARDLRCGRSSLKGLLDLMLVIGRSEEPFWDQLRRRAAEWKGMGDLTTVLGSLRGHLAAPVPEALSGAAIPAEALAYGIGTPDPWEGYAALLREIGTTPGAGAKARLLAGLLFPSARTLEHRYRLPPGTPRTHLYFKRALSFFLRAVGSRRRARGSSSAAGTDPKPLPKGFTRER